MVFDINEIKSHPDKLLLDHTSGVINNVKKLTNSKLAELVATFHDLGKINPNFQDKLINKNNQEYSHHSYLSAYAFFCAFATLPDNRERLKEFLGWENITSNDVIGISVLIAKHHGNLPDFTPIDIPYTGVSILSKEENKSLFDFLSKNMNLPIVAFVNNYFQIKDPSNIILDKRTQHCYLDRFVFNHTQNNNALDFYLDFQFAFASVLQADKADAAKFDNFIEQQQQDVESFTKNFEKRLNSYLSKLKQDTELNKLRTRIRQEAVNNVTNYLKDNRRVFELTAPTGSGKTLMLLSLANEIIKQKGSKRIIYGLPFLSITEQVENEVLKIFSDYEYYIQRVDSKSENSRFEKVQNELDNNPTEDNISEMELLEFQENTFAYPFVITTFVRFFETLLSNSNAELLKLPNFANSIFLLDEIQSLPPRLYGFFAAYLSKFCTKFNSYVIFSTATQPNLELPTYDNNIGKFFPSYSKPKSLLSLEYFNNNLFNRYSINYNQDAIDLETLKNDILNEKTSVLVILNTIDDTKELFKLLQNELSNDELILINTHFTPQDRKLKIYLAKRRLRESKRIIVISTQLIEAGVDIDFPILYRDFATVASIVQSAGRCNRNGKQKEKGKVCLFRLRRNGRERSKLIYQGKDEDLWRFTKGALQNQKYNENELLQVQTDFFNRIQNELNFGQHVQEFPKIEFNFLEDIQQCMFDKIGKFHLIDSSVYGEELQYFVARNNKDDKFEVLIQKQDELFELLKNKAEKATIRNKKREINAILKKMSNQILQIRLKNNQQKPLLSNPKKYFSLHKIDKYCYSFVKGIDVKGEEIIL